MPRLSQFSSQVASQTLRSLLSASPGERLLSDCLTAGGRPFIMGGAVRDVVAQGITGLAARSPRDIDIGIEGLQQKQFAAIIEAHGATHNRHGGYRLSYSSFPYWDIWRVEETVGLRKHKEAKTVENVLRSFVLDCNAIAYNIAEDHFLDLDALSSFRRGEISLLDDAILHDEPVFAAKALICHLSLEMNLSPTLIGFIKTHLNPSSLAHELSKYREAVDHRDICSIER